MAGEVLNATLAPVGVREKEDAGDPVYLRIRDLVYQTCGIYHSDEKLYLLVAACKRRVASGGVKASNAREYLDALMSIAYKDAETRALLNEITIGETCLFRSMPQVNALKNVILPEMAQERSKIGLKKLKVWSAGCSTGEEPYTWAMFLLEQKNGLLKDWTFEIPGVDINEEAANLVQFQNAYQASAQVSSVIDTLMQTTINMVAGT